MSQATMSSRQRMMAAIKREGPDHVPFSPYISQGPWFQEPLFWQDQIGRAERMLDIGLDPTIDIWLPDPQPHRDVEIRTWREKKGHEIILTKEYHTPAGVMRQVVCETDGWCSHRHGPWIPTTWGTEKRDQFGMDLFDDYNVSRRVEPWVKGREDLDKLRYIIRLPEGHVLDEWRMDSERAMEYAERFKVLTMARRTIVGDAFQWFCDIPWFVLQLYDDQEFVNEFLDIFQKWSMELIALALEVGIDVVQYRGWYEIPAFWGPTFWNQYICWRIEEQAKLTHSAGKHFVYLLPEGQGAYSDLLRRTSIDVLQGIDPRMLHGWDLQSLYGKLGDAKAFWGGVNAEVTLRSIEYLKIEQEVIEAIETLGANGGLILSAFVFPEVPVKGTMHMIEAWKKYCSL